MGNNVEFTTNGNFKKDAKDSFEKVLKRRAKERANMTPEEKEEHTRKLEQQIAERRKWVDDHDEEGVFKKMRELMEDPNDPLYHTYTHDGDGKEYFDVEPSAEDWLTINEYKQFRYLEGMTHEEALKECGSPQKVTEKIVIWGDETKAELEYAELLISIFGEEVSDPYTDEEKEEFRREEAEHLAKVEEAKRNGTYKEYDKSEFEKTSLVADIVYCIDIDDHVPLNVEDEFLEVYNSLPENEKRAFDLRMEGLTLRDSAEKMGISHEAVRQCEERAIKKMAEAFETICRPHIEE